MHDIQFFIRQMAQTTFNGRHKCRVDTVSTGRIMFMDSLLFLSFDAFCWFFYAHLRLTFSMPIQCGALDNNRPNSKHLKMPCQEPHSSLLAHTNVAVFVDFSAVRDTLGSLASFDSTIRGAYFTEIRPLCSFLWNCSLLIAY